MEGNLGKLKGKQNTIDLDFCTKNFVVMVIKKILRNECLEGLACKRSFSKGYHITLWCSKSCDICRLVFDDETRFSLDQLRPEVTQNILFDDYYRCFVSRKAFTESKILGSFSMNTTLALRREGKTVNPRRG